MTAASLFACGGDGGTGPVTLDLARSTLAVASGPYIAGQSYTATFTARDNNGDPYLTPLVVVFDLTGGTSDGTFSAVTSSGPGVYQVTFQATTAGTASQLSVSVGGSPLAGSLPAVTVVPGAVSVVQSTVVVGASSVALGNVTTATVTVRDAFGNIRSPGGDVVVFTKGLGTSDGSFSTTTDNGNGTYTATFTATTVGTARSIGATIGGAPLTSAAPTITVTPGSASLTTSTVTAGSAAIVSGAQTTLTLAARDAAGNALTTGGLVVTFTKGAGTSDGSISAVTDNGNGTYTATFTATTAGTARTIGATIGGAAVTSASPAITVSAATVSTAQSIVTLGSAQVVAGAMTTVTLTARNAVGAQLITGGLVVVFTKGTGTSDGTFSAVTDNNNGTYSATFTATTAGTARQIRATIGGVTITSAAPTITVTLGATSLAQSTVTVGVASVVSGSGTTLTLTTRDAAGNARTTGGETVAFTTGTGTSGGNISAVTDNNNGTYTATFTGTTAGTARAIGAAVGGTPLTSASPTITVTPGTASLVQSTVVVGTASITSGTGSALTLITRDAAGNARTTTAGTVLFTKGTGTSDGSLSAATNNNNGTYTATFTGTIAGTPRAIGATIAGNAITSTAPTITVNPGLASPLSIVSVSAATIGTNESSTLTLTARDLAGNAVTSGGATVLFTKGTGTSDGTISTVNDNGNGTYTATFTGNVAGTARQIGATLNGAAITTVLPTVLVLPPPTMALGTDTVHVNVQVNTTSSVQLVTVANIGSGTVAGLSTTNASLAGGAAQCASVNWLATPTFDMGGTAAPLSLMSVQVNATGLSLGTCARAVTVASSTPGVTARQLVVVANVGRAPVAEGAVRVVMMGNSNSSSLQTITPTPFLTIANGGRGSVTGVSAIVASQTGFAECTDPSDDQTCAPWLVDADLQLSSTTLPTTLTIVSQVRPFFASAVIRVSGTGMATRDFPVEVFFNREPALVTNARNLLLKGRLGGAVAADTVVALNQNTSNPGLTNYRLDSTRPVPSWMTVTFQPSGGTANVIVSANLATFTRDTVVSDTVGIQLLADCTIVLTCEYSPTKQFLVPFVLIVERGLVTSLSNATLFAPIGGTVVTQDLTVTNSGAEQLTGLTATIGAGATWLTASFVGSTVTPATLRLTANPAGRTAGQYNTTVTVRTGSGATLQTRIIPVRLTVF